MAEGIPVQKVIELKSKGADNNKIIDSLRSEGFNFQQIRDAIEQANIKKTVSNPGMDLSKEVPKPTTPAPTQNIPVPQMNNTQTAPMPQNTPMQTQAQNYASKSQGMDLDQVQRILEEIIAEKWSESSKIIQSITEWKAVVNTKIKEFDTRMSEFNTRIDSLNTILGKKADDFNNTMQNVDTEIQALEKALNKLVPTLSDNIGELRNIVGKNKR